MRRKCGLFVLMMCLLAAMMAPAAFGSTAETELIKQDDMTRQEWLHDLVQVFSLTMDKDEYPDNYYPDVTEDTEYYADIMSAVGRGVIDTDAGDDLEPEGSLDRDFAAYTLSYCMGYTGSSESYSFSDTDAVTHKDAALENIG